MERLRAQGRGFPAGAATVPIVPGAILFDLYRGQQKSWAANPYSGLGAAAFDAAAADFTIGSAGAGTGAMTAMLKGGLGSTSLVLDGGATVGALVAANPVGSVTTPGDRHFFAASFEMGDEFGGIGPDPLTGQGLFRKSRKFNAFREAQNTVIAIVATDAALTKAQCHRVATAAHDGIARACVPAHTPNDGDIVFALSHGDRPADPLMVGHAAALCLSRAVARAVYAAISLPGDPLPSWKDMNES
jgi:D-aminopeptidase